jgi:RNA polymerase sigma factor (sigma-70 family)
VPEPVVPDTTLAQIVRDEAGLIVASLYRRIGDFDVAEESVQEAVVAALRTWRVDGVPPNPGAWLRLVARRQAIDRLRRSVREERATDALTDAERRARLLAEQVADPAADLVGVIRAAESASDAADERIPMLFGCCHPALRVEARLALMLRAVVGLTTPQIARAFLVPEATMAQRLVRAKRKIVAVGIGFEVPTGSERASRLDEVLTAIYLAYNAGYLSRDDRTLTEDAIWLAELVARSLPDEAEAWGLLALITNLSARATARFDPTGRLVLLSDQDRSRWDRVAIARAEGYLVRSAALRRPGRYQLQAAIAACHADAQSWAATDWLQILTLYDLLLSHDPSPVVRLNHAIALGHVSGAAAALLEVDAVADRLADYHLLHATRAQLLAELGDLEEARAANVRALELTDNPAEQELLRARIAAYVG